MRLREFIVRHLDFSKSSIIEVRELFGCSDYALNLERELQMRLFKHYYRENHVDVVLQEITRSWHLAEIIWRHSHYAKQWDSNMAPRSTSNNESTQQI